VSTGDELNELPHASAMQQRIIEERKKRVNMGGGVSLVPKWALGNF
jgi:hypothetical protein